MTVVNKFSQFFFILSSINLFIVQCFFYCFLSDAKCDASGLLIKEL